MEVRFDRWKELFRKRSIPGWICWVLIFFWRRLGDVQSVDWLMQHLHLQGWAGVWKSFTVPVIFFIAGALWFLFIALVPQRRKRLSIELLKSRFVAENLGESTNQNFREAYNIFLHIRLVTSGSTRLSLASATLELKIDNATHKLDSRGLEQFRLKEQFEREQPVFGSTRDMRWVMLPSALHLVLEPGVYGNGWLRFYLDNVAPNDLEGAEVCLSLVDALGARYKISKHGLAQDRSVVIYDRELLGQ